MRNANTKSHAKASAALAEPDFDFEPCLFMGNDGGNARLGSGKHNQLQQYE
jgi:hypothetical protein